jgi:hypothetical protein
LAGAYKKNFIRQLDLNFYLLVNFIFIYRTHSPFFVFEQKKNKFKMKDDAFQILLVCFQKLKKKVKIEFLAIQVDNLNKNKICFSQISYYFFFGVGETC